MLRRLIPGVIQNTPNAGYYAFYPYLLWTWEQLDGDISSERSSPSTGGEGRLRDRMRAHEHRDGVSLTGINGAIAARQQVRDIEAGATEVDLAAFAENYIDTRLGGYGLFYAAALQDARLVRAGQRTSSTEPPSTALLSPKRSPRLRADQVLPGVLHDRPGAGFGAPGARRGRLSVYDPWPVDHELLLDTFFGDELPGQHGRTVAGARREPQLAARVPRSAARRRSRGSRCVAACTARAPVLGWRRLDTAHAERRNPGGPISCARLRSCADDDLEHLSERARERQRATHADLAAEMTSWLDAERLGFDPQLRLDAAMHAAQEQTPTAYQLAEDVEPLLHEWRDERERAFCRALRVLAVMPPEIARQANGFTELLDEGGSHRWSLQYLDGWLGGRVDRRFAEMAIALLDALHHQHVRVALGKVRVPSAQNLGRYKGDWRDPFNFAEDDGVLRPLRPDEPFWTGARYGVGNHLLWTLGLLSAPAPPTALTDLGRDYVRTYARA